MQTEMMPDQVNGRTPRDTDGDLLAAGRIYCVSRRGTKDQFFKVFEADCELYCQAVRLSGVAIPDSRPTRIDLIDRACRWQRL